MKDGDKQRVKRVRRALDIVNGTLDDIKKRQDGAIERFKKEHPNRPVPGIPKNKNAVTIDPESQLQLEAAQIGIRIALATGSWFFENKEIVELGSQTEEEHKLYKDPTGLFEARAVIEAAKRGDDPQLGFPKPIKIKNRLLYRRRDVEEFERLNEVEALITVEMLVRIFTRLDRIGGVTNSLGLECSLDDRPQ